MNWKISKNNDVCYDLDIRAERNKNWEQWVLVQSDEHIDNPKSDIALHKHHLEQAKERNAPVLKFGDFFDMMQTKGDRRSHKKDLKPELATGSYLNDMVDLGVKELMPFKENIAFISEGNHETAPRNHGVEYSVTRDLVKDLHREGSPAIAGGYRGFIRFKFTAGTFQKTLNAYFTHGYGGGGPVTKGTIQVNRKAVYLRNVDLVFSGHVHERWLMWLTQVGVNQAGVEVSTEQVHVQLATYKDEFTGVPGGWAHEKGLPPKPKGGWWIRFYFSARTNSIEFELVATDK